ncbi:MAG: hypothetical protein F4W92_08530 [Gammaproteobacteria bacterium]|nr:hypothetical protein [Gammaproteobacteria bacterium]
MKRSVGFLLLLLTSGIVVGVGSMCLIYLATSSKGKTENYVSHEFSDTPSAQPIIKNNEIAESEHVKPTDRHSTLSIEDPSLHRNSFLRRFAIYSYVSGLTEQALTHELQESSQARADLSYRIRDELQLALLERLAMNDRGAALNFAVVLDELAASVSNQKQALRDSIPDTEIAHMPLVQYMFTEWALNDLKGAMDKASSLDTVVKSNALTGILSAQVGEPLTTYRDIAKELGDEQLGIDTYISVLTMSLDENPKVVWEELVSLSNSDIFVEKQTFNTFARLWYKQVGFSVIDEIQKSTINEDIKFNAIQQIFWRETNDDHEQAFEAARKLPETRQYSGILSYVVRGWAFSDPRSAYQAASSIERSALRQNLQTAAVIEWAHAEPRYVVDNLDSFPNVYHVNAVNNALIEILIQSPKEAAEIALRQTNAHLRLTLPAKIMRTWVETDVEAAINWVYNGPVSDERRYEWVRALITFLDDSDPRRAFELAVEQELPGEKFFAGYIGLEASVISNLVYRNLELATELLPKVREGNTKLSAFNDVGDRYIVQGNHKKAFDLGAQLAKEQQEEYFQNVCATWASRNTEEFVASIKTIPTEELRSSVARHVIEHMSGYFTESQLNVLKLHLSDSDRQALENR